MALLFLILNVTNLKLTLLQTILLDPHPLGLFSTRHNLINVKLFLILKHMLLKLDKSVELQALHLWYFLILFWLIIKEVQLWNLVMDKAILTILDSLEIHTSVLFQDQHAPIAMELTLFLALTLLEWECWLFLETVRICLRNLVMAMILSVEHNHMKIRFIWTM